MGVASRAAALAAVSLSCAQLCGMAPNNVRAILLNRSFFMNAIGSHPCPDKEPNLPENLEHVGDWKLMPRPYLQ